jgi:acyl transferase domain-containing protein/acyl carrier protein
MDNTHAEESFEDVAIIGLSGRFPGAPGPEQFWQNLRDGVESISFFTDQELRDSGIGTATLAAPHYVKARAVINNVDLLDAGFFALTPREAELLDPQHRLFMECAWEALEHAAYNPETYSGAIGVFAGASSNTYLLSNLLSNREAMASAGPFQTAIANALDFLATRISYKFNLRGPSVTVQTACSTSLVAVHTACQSLLNGECDIALAGGIAINVPHQSGYMFEEGGILSPDGHCRPFDAQAQGTVPGSGTGIVVLKRLTEALADGDYIHAVIKGSAINNDGSQKIGYTAPSVDGQASVIADALRVARVEPETITYIEAHGTGTALGDPIEFDALRQVFHARAPEQDFCAIGSCKSNVGHLDAAAGVSGLIKVVLALKAKQIPPLIHLHETNPQIDLTNTPFYFNTKLIEWKSRMSARRAGVSSFGIGGTNAHVVLEEAPARPATKESPLSSHLLVLSARTNTALPQVATALAAHLKENPALNLADVANTLQIGRKAHKHRGFVVAENIADAVSQLEAWVDISVASSIQERRERPVAFMFPGQGAQYVNMAKTLYEEVAAFRAQIDMCAELLVPHLGFDLRDAIFPQLARLSGEQDDAPDAEREDEAAHRLQQTFVTQPALFVIEYALAKMWMQWGVHPQVMIGHSIGEYVAACLAGVFSLEDALALVAARGRMIQGLPGGRMLAVTLSEAEAQTFLRPGLSLAALNSPSLSVVAGEPEAVSALEEELTARGVAYTRLHTSHAFHSSAMDAILDEFTALVRSVKRNPPRLPFISNVTARMITTEEALSPEYWAGHLRHPVRFSDGLGDLLADPELVLLEVGPGQTLSSLARQHPHRQPQQVILNSVRHPREQRPDTSFLLNALGQLWLAGVEINWRDVDQREVRCRLPLPSYPFERQRYWIEPNTRHDGFASGTSLSAKPDTTGPLYTLVWKQSAQLPAANSSADDSSTPHWLIFMNEEGLGSRIARHLREAGARVITVTAASAWVQAGEDSYRLNPQQRQGYEALFKDLKARNLIPAKVLHLFNLEAEGEALPGDGLSRAEESFFSLLFLAQSLGAQGSTTPVEIAVVSNDMQAVTGVEALRPEKATLLGLCRVIPQEYPNFSCRSVDVELPAPGSDGEARLIRALLDEFSAPDAEVVCAYRGKRRWIQVVEELNSNHPARTIPLREDGVYLITGGQTHTGVVFAEFLASLGKTRLALLVPPASPTGEGLDERSGNEADEGDARRLGELVRQLESSGGRVLVIRADVSEQAQMKAAIGQITQEFGSLHGVLHTEGVPGGGFIQLKTVELAKAVLKPKVRATLALDAALQGIELDFFALFSSSTATTGGIGQADYCAANSFLNAFSHSRNMRGDGLTVAIEWDPFKWEGLHGPSISAAPNVQSQLEHTLEAFGLTEEESIEAFRDAIASGLPQVIVSKRDFSNALEQYRKTTVASLMEQFGQNRASGTAYLRPALSVPYEAPRNGIEGAIADIWKDLFGIEQIGVHDTFFELGGSSLLAIQLITRLRETFGEDIAMSSIFEQPTVAGLAEIIGATQLGAEELEQIDMVFEQIKDLSPEELDALLAEDPDASSAEDVNV